jgi:hypothetical protein
MVAEHSVASGASLEMGSDGERWYTSSCSCGWSSERCRSEVLAEAWAEQHVTLTARRPHAES